MKRILLVFSALYLSIVVSSFAQSVPFPPEPNYNTLAPWGYTQSGTNWNTTPYLPFKYQGLWFRLMPPNGVTYNSNTNTWTNSDPSKKYPMMVFSTGAGERGTDNNRQLLHGGQVHMQAVQSGRFPGFLLFWQTESGYLEADKIQAIVDKLVADLPVDINRIYCEGFSRGGTITWQFVRDKPRTWAATFPMSAASGSLYNPEAIHIPARLAQGGLDTNPLPAEADDLIEEYTEDGGNLEYFFFPTLGHGTWNTCYALPDFYEWFLAQKKNQIHVFFGDPEVCPGDPISVKLGMTAGFDGYEWIRDGGPAVLATTNNYTATSFGSYQARFRRGSTWTEWSEPVVVKVKDPTQTPPITTTGLRSTVLPAVDGSTSVPLELPTGYESYTWKNSSNAVIGTARTITISTPGTYTANVVAVGGCSSLDSPPFTVVDANGPNAPDPISNLRLTPSGLTAMELNWENNPTPINNETGFEIYRSESEAGPFTLVKINAADVLNYVDPGLISSKAYSYIIRAINTTGASAASDVTTAVTGLDVIAPTVPGSLSVQSYTPTSVSLRWTSSSDNVGVVGYDVYVNGVKAYVVTSTSSTINFTVNSLITNTLYNFVIRARDAAGNSSPPSNQVTRHTTGSGLNYKFYTGSWTAVPDFSVLTPTKIGWLTNFSTSPRTQTDNFGFQYTGKLNITYAGTYTFYLQSDAGSKLYIDNVLNVNHDGLHSSTELAGTPIVLAAGVHDIRVDYFDATGSDGLTVRWSKTSPNSIPKQSIPNSALTDVFTPPAVPVVPGAITVTAIDYQSINVTWPTYSGTGTSIEIQRSTNNSSWATVMTVPASQSTFINSSLNPSTTYYYRIRAIGSTGESSYTSTNPAKSATTQALPPIPAVPSNLVLVNVGSDSDSIAWTDNSNNETSFEIQKSIGDNLLFQVVGTVAGSNAATGGYKDLGLFAHTTYFYRIRARNVTGASAFSNNLQVVTTNSNPVISPLDTFALRYDETKVFPITASDADGDQVFIEGVNLPDFVNLFDYGDGTAELFIEPTAADQGVYSNLQINAIDGFGGTISTFFTFTVNNNHSPLINPVTPVTVKETYIVNSVLTASDADGDPIEWELTDLPSFVTYTISSDGDSLRFTIAPQEVNAGNYSIGLKVKDSQDNYSLGSLDIQVQEFNPAFFVRVNFGTNSSGPAPWNNANTGATPTAGTTFSSLVDQNGASTSLGLTLQTTWTAASQTGGVPTGFTGGIYPTVVMTSYYTTGPSADPEVIVVTGLNPNNKYNFDLLAARNTTGDRRTIFQIGAQSITIDGGYNTTQLAKFTNIVPNASGQVSITVSAAAVPGTSSASGSINAMVIESFYDGILPPAPPTSFAVGYSESNDINLTWTDNADNETGFEVFRSTDGVSFTQVATLSENVTAAPSQVISPDLNTVPFTTYYYTVRAVNGNGNSAFTDTLSIDGLNKAPVIAPIAPISIGEEQTKDIQVTATDPEGGVIYFMLENAPAFVSIMEVSNGVATLIVAPVEGDTGSYNFNLLAMDEFGYFSSMPVTVNVSDFVETFVYVDFARGDVATPSTWNRVASGATSPYNVAAGLAVNNMNDASGGSTTIDIAMTSSWQANLNGNNSSILYPADVSRSSFFYSGASRTITLSGLKLDQVYDLSFLSSRDLESPQTNRHISFTANGVTSNVVNASNNATVLSQMFEVHPDASGQIVITVNRVSPNTGSITINSLVIREYTDNGLPTKPSNLSAGVLSRTSIKLNWIDQSTNETGFEVWRSVGNSSNYQLLTTAAAGVQTLTDGVGSFAPLAQSTAYYYKVRAKVEAGDPDVFSEYSNEIEARTFVSSVSLNFGAVTTAPGLAPAPWNNIQVLQLTPNSYYNCGNGCSTTLLDDIGNNSGMTYYTIEPFLDDNINGMNTGNNSGIVPDAVMQTAWYVDKNTFASFRIENLNLTWKYNFGFFASRNGSENRTGVYTINGTSVTLNAANNTSNMVFINNVSPDANGRITVTVAPQDDEVSLGYLNALVIQVTQDDAPAPAPAQADAARAASEETTSDITVYPNPFTNHVTITVESQKEIAQVALLTATGSAVYSEMEVEESSREHYVDFTNINLNSGMYYMKVKFTDGSNRTVKLLRK